MAMATTREKQPLYLAGDLEELNKRAEDNSALQKAKLMTCAQMTHMIEQTWLEAKKSEVGCDEERAYILFVRLFACFTALKQAKDIASHQVSPARSLLALRRSL